MMHGDGGSPQIKRESEDMCITLNISIRWSSFFTLGSSGIGTLLWYLLYKDQYLFAGLPNNAWRRFRAT